MAEGEPVAVLGAGMAGAAAAHALAAAGLPVKVFDKGRGPGGRMATRHTREGLRFDHGAQSFSARGEAFRARCADWVARGLAVPWGDRDHLVGVPGMTAPVADLLDGLPVSQGTAIVRLDRTGEGWMLADAEGAAAGPFAAVAVTVPAPQAAALFAASGLTLPGPERATYAPCWSLLLDLDAAPFAEARLALDDGPIALVAREASKPCREAGGRLVVHASPSWSRAHLEEERDAVQAALIAELEILIGRSLGPTYAAAHRWRYAMVETPLGEPCLYDPGLRVGAAGDWCLGPRIEAAFDSGLALAGRILAEPAGAR